MLVIKVMFNTIVTLILLGFAVSWVAGVHYVATTPSITHVNTITHWDTTMALGVLSITDALINYTEVVRTLIDMEV